MLVSVDSGDVWLKSFFPEELTECTLIVSVNNFQGSFLKYVNLSRSDYEGYSKSSEPPFTKF